MRKFYSILAAFLLSLMAWGEAHTVPYASNIAISATTIDPEWTITDLNAESDKDATWTAYGDDKTKLDGVFDFAARYKYGSSIAGDDYLISPAIHLEAGKEYVVMFYMRTYNSTMEEKLDFYKAEGNTPEAFKATEPLFSFTGAQDTWKKHSYKITPDHDADYYFAFYAHSEKNKWYIYIANFSVVENVFAPAAVSNLHATAGENRALTVDLQWSLPTTDQFGIDLSDGQTVEQVNIYRDGSEDPVKTFYEAATSWQDTESSGLTAGYHTYSVEVVVSGTKSARANAMTGYVGPVAPMALPFSQSFPTAGDFNDLWVVTKGNDSTIGDTKLWAWESYGNGRIACYTAKNKQEDEWLISPPLIFPEAGIYKIVFKGCTNSNYYKSKIELYLGTGYSSENMTQIIDGNVPANTSAINPSTHTYMIQVDQAGTYYVGIHAACNPSEGVTYYCYGLEVEQSEIIPQAVSGLVANVSEAPALEVTLNWTNPVNDLAGNPLADDFVYLLEVYRNDVLISTITDKSDSYVDNGIPESGVYTYTIKAVTPSGRSADEHATVTTTWVGDATVSLPYSTDFSDATSALWTPVDADGDGNTWYPGTGEMICKQGAEDDDDYYSYCYNNDYLLSPAMNLTPGYYTVSFKIKGNSFPYYVGVLTDKEPSSKNDMQQSSGEKTTKSYYETLTYNFTISEEGTYYVAWAIIGYTEYKSAYNHPRLDDVTISKRDIVPALATDLSVEAAEDHALSATVSWVNPTASNIEGVEPVLSHAVVYRDGVELAIVEPIVAGETSSYIDSDITVAGYYTYKVEIYSADGKSSDKAPEVRSPWIGGGLDLPCTFEEFSGWTIYNVNGDRRTLYDYYDEPYYEDITWEPNLKGISITSTSIAADDWAISPRMQFEDGAVYEVEVVSYAGYGNDVPYSWDLAYSPDDSYSGMVNLSTITTNAQLLKDAQSNIIKIKAVKDIPTTENEDEDGDGSDADDSDAIIIPAGINTIGFHANTKGAVTVKSLAIKHSNVGVENIATDRQQNFVIADGAVIFNGTATGAAIYDITGKLVSYTAEASDRIPTDGLAHGIYIIKANINGQNVTVKISK